MESNTATSNSTFTAGDGAGYERLMGRWSRRLAEPFLDFAGLAPGAVEGRLLDVGCGTGSLSQAIAARAGFDAIRGVDASAPYIDHAIARNTDSRIVFQIGDACDLPFADRSFDRAFCFLVLHFVREPARAVAEMKRVVKPGGSIAAAVWDARGGFVANRMFFDTAAVLDPEAVKRRARHFTRPMTRPGELAAAWRTAGLADIREAALTIRMEFAGFEDYWAPYVGKDGPGAQYVATLDEAQRSRLRECVRLAYLDGEPDGPRSYAATAWAVTGTVPQ